MARETSSDGAAFLPYARQSIDETDIAAVERVLRGDYLTTGPEVPLFEAEFAAAVGAPHVVACCNGTAALHLASLCLDLRPGDQVIVPSVSFVATANAPRHAGAEIVFADVDPDTGLLTAATAGEAISRADPDRLRALFVVHLGGHPVDLESISALARAHGLALVEDACHALGTTHRLADGREARIGDCELSDFTTFSLHAVKTITAGEGGVVTTRHADASSRMGILRNHGLVRDPLAWVDPGLGRDALTGDVNPWVYELQLAGHNYRLTDLQAALARSQLARLASFAAARRGLAETYRKHLAPLAPLVRPVTPPGPPADPVLHLFSVLVDFEAAGVSRAAAMQVLKRRGIGTQVHYIPIHRQPLYRRGGLDGAFPGGEAYYRRTLSLPFHPGLTDRDVERVTATLAEVLGR